MTHHDSDYGTLSAHLVDDGSIEIHRVSSATGLREVMQLGTVAVQIAVDILTLSGEAQRTVVQRIADAMEMSALAGNSLSPSEAYAMAVTLRSGIAMPVRERLVGGNVVSFRRIG